MCGTTYFSLQSSNTLNYWRMITHRASESVYCSLPLSAIDGLSRLTKLTTNKGAGTADSNIMLCPVCNTRLIKTGCIVDAVCIDV